MSYSLVPRSVSGTIDEGCPGQWYLIDKNDNPSCADECPAGWTRQIDQDINVQWCKQPANAADLPTIEEAAAEYEASQAAVKVGLVAAGALILVGVGLWYATSRRRPVRPERG